MDEKLIVVSSDSHAAMPQDLWPEYLDNRFHDLLPDLRRDHIVYRTAISVLKAKNGTNAQEEFELAHRTGWHGLYDPILRLADMDREGIASEIIYHADHRLGDLFHNAPIERSHSRRGTQARRGGTGGRRTRSGSRTTGST